MREKQANQVIEAEVLDEQGLPVSVPLQEHTEKEVAQAGFFAGFVALCFSFIMILLMAVVTVFILFPLMLLGRMLGLQIRSFRR